MEEIIIPVVAILMPLVLVPTIITLKHRHGRREWEHLERMKAMDLGLPAPTGSETWGAKSVVPIGAGVPIASVFFAFLTCTEGPASVDGVPLAAILIPLGFFLSVAFSPDRPNEWIRSLYAGALVLAISVVVLGVGLIRA